jgi:hypothetical protein
MPLICSEVHRFSPSKGSFKSRAKISISFFQQNGNAYKLPNQIVKLELAPFCKPGTDVIIEKNFHQKMAKQLKLLAQSTASFCKI